MWLRGGGGGGTDLVGEQGRTGAGSQGTPRSSWCLRCLGLRSSVSRQSPARYKTLGITIYVVSCIWRPRYRQPYLVSSHAMSMSMSMPMSISRQPPTTRGQVDRRAATWHGTAHLVRPRLDDLLRLCCANHRVDCASGLCQSSVQCPVAWAQFSAIWSHHYTGDHLSPPQFDRLDAATSDSIAGRK
jgi:hypothetical protein